MKLLIVSCVLFGIGISTSWCQTGASARRSPTVEVLPLPKRTGAVPVEEAIGRRRSVRSFENRDLTEQQISQLLYAAQGITDTSRSLRAAPSAGATYPLECYLVTREGVFRYLPAEHALEAVKKRDVRQELGKAALGQSCMSSAPAVVAFTAIPERTTGRYGDRGHRYIYMEAGHAAQNVHLQAVALGLGSVPVGAFDDDAVCKALGCGGKEKAIYLMPVGRLREDSE
jgi:SagB-type dehydrogenase family enzyme